MSRVSVALATARNRRAQLAEMMRQHARVCRDCRPLTDTRARYCQDGWQLAKDYRAAMAAVTDLEGPPPVQAATLF